MVRFEQCLQFLRALGFRMSRGCQAVRLLSRSPPESGAAALPEELFSSAARQQLQLLASALRSLFPIKMHLKHVLVHEAQINIGHFLSHPNTRSQQRQSPPTAQRPQPPEQPNPRLLTFSSSSSSPSRRSNILRSWRQNGVKDSGGEETRKRGSSETVRKRVTCAPGSCSEDTTALFTFLSSSSRAEQSVRRSCLCRMNVSKSVRAAQPCSHTRLLPKLHLNRSQQSAGNPCPILYCGHATVGVGMCAKYSHVGR